MKLKSKRFYFEVSYPALCLFSSIIIINYEYLYCIAAFTFHELGHLTVMLFFKVKIKGVSVSVFNIKISENARHTLIFKKDIIVTAAGPVFNLLLFILFISTYQKFALINLFIGLFNLLPAASLDGGQIIYLILSKYNSNDKSAFILDIITIIVSVPLFLIGIIILFESKYNFSLLFISLYLILSLFIKDDCYL